MAEQLANLSKTEEKVAFITGSLTSSGALLDKNENYPDGFSPSNSHIIGFSYESANVGQYRSGEGCIGTGLRVFVRENNNGQITVSSNLNGTLYYLITLYRYK